MALVIAAAAAGDKSLYDPVPGKKSCSPLIL
jgi:hypothetical protein